MTEELFEVVTEWQRKTFPDATMQSALKHLQSEIVELENAPHIAAVLEEFADCFLLLYGAADRAGLDYWNICCAGITACMFFIEKIESVWDK